MGSLPQAHAEGRDTEATVDGGYKERFGRYLLLERLGRGGMAEVFKAVAEGAQGFRRVFVVKRILPEFAASPYFVSLFADEAKLSALLHHPNLVQVYEFGAVAGVHYLSMEYLDGTDLASVMAALAKNRQHLPPSLAVFIAQQVAHGLAYAHAATDEQGAPLRLVHRDVSPENIMLMDAGTVKLFDFGIALSDQRLATSITQGKVLKGKLAYSSPEQVKGQTLDGRSDIFSLGVVMWEMLTGRRLFAGDDDARTLYNVLERQVTPPSHYNPHVPPGLDGVVLRALARDPSERHPNADVLSEELDDVLRGLSHHRTDLPKLLARLAGPRPVTPAAGHTILRAVGPIAQEETTDETADLRIIPFAPPTGLTPSGPSPAVVAQVPHCLPNLPAGDTARKRHQEHSRQTGGGGGCPEAVVETDMSIPAWKPRFRGSAATRAALALATALGLLAAVKGLGTWPRGQQPSPEFAAAAPVSEVPTRAPVAIAPQAAPSLAASAAPSVPEPAARAEEFAKLAAEQGATGAAAVDDHENIEDIEALSFLPADVVVDVPAVRPKTGAAIIRRRLHLPTARVALRPAAASPAPVRTHAARDGFHVDPFAP